MPPKNYKKIIDWDMVEEALKEVKKLEEQELKEVRGNENI